MKDYGIYEKVKLNGIVPGRLIRHTRADSAIIKSHWHPELEINTVFEGSSRFFITAEKSIRLSLFFHRAGSALQGLRYKSATIF